MTYQVTKNLNRVIDRNYYPIPEARNSNMRHRPVGLGVQGLADAFIMMRLPFDSDEARQLNKDVFETIYYAACSASKDMAIEEGAYETFKAPRHPRVNSSSTCGTSPRATAGSGTSSRSEIMDKGMRNSLLVAPMPTASTAQILGNNECFEPYTSNIYTRRTLSGEFIIVNKHLLRDLTKLGLWDEDMKNQLIAANGSVQNIPNIPENLKVLYRTAWEIPQRAILDMAADRGAYICQSQSLNVFMENANAPKLTSMHFHAWRSGLKTGMYYLRTKAATDAIKFTVDKKYKDQPTEAAKEVAAMSHEEQVAACSIENGPDCEMCSG